MSAESTSAGREVLSPETYWGPLITPKKTLSPTFSRLITAIFCHFDATSAGALQPTEFCALMLAAGYSKAEFPPLKISTFQSPSPTDMHELDAWLANWFQSFPLDHHMATRKFPPPPPVKPHDGRIRLRDQLLHALIYPPAPVVQNGSPMLSQRGLEQYFTHQLLTDPDNLCIRLNHFLGKLPRLTDPQTGRPFEAQRIPRACFPLVSDQKKKMKTAGMGRVTEEQAEVEELMQQQIEYAYAVRKMQEKEEAAWTAYYTTKAAMTKAAFDLIQ